MPTVAHRRSIGIPVFSSAVDDTRLRRPTDVLLIVGSFLVLVPLTLLAPGPTQLDQTIAQLLRELGPIWDWVWDVSYLLLAVWPLLLVLLALASTRRRRLLVDWLVAALVAIGFALVLGRVAGTAWSASLGAVTSTAPPQVYVAARLALASAVIVAASPHLSRPFKLAGRAVLLFGGLSGVALGIAYPIGALAGFAAGVAAGATAHLLLGSPSGSLGADDVAEILGDLGLQVSEVEVAPTQTPGTSSLTAVSSDGRPLLVKVYGRDAWDSQFLASMWTALVRRGERPHLARGRRGQVEHEAVTTLMAERAGVPVLPVVTVGESFGGDAVIVTELTGTSLFELPDDAVGEDFLRAVWRALVGLHAVGIAHGRIDRYHVLGLADGGAALADLGDAELAASHDALTTDGARLLVATSIRAGHEPAVAAALAELGPAGLAELLPYLQPAVLDRGTRRDLKDGTVDLGLLRTAAAEAAGTPPPPLQRLRRVTLKSAAITLGGTLLAVAIVSKLLSVDFASIAQELADANWWWLTLALLLSPTVQVAYSGSTMGASPKPLRYGPVLMLQYAIQFIAVALPATAARLALEVRFFQGFGLEAAGALSIGLIDSVSGLFVQVVLIAVIALTSLPGLTSPAATGTTSSTSSGSSTWEIILSVVVVLLVTAMVTLLIPASRRRIKVLVARGRSIITNQRQSAREALTVLRRPVKVGEMLAGNFGAQVLQAVILSVCLTAFGSHAHLSQLILVNTLVSLFAGLMPVPGGVGVAEAGYIAGLQAIGIPSAVAISTALAFRLVTFYLPPLWGSLAMRWLRRNQYL